MKQKLLMASVLLSLSMSANAAKDNDGTICNGNGSCGQTTNNNTTNQGGTGIGVGVGISGASSNSSATNTSTNLNTNVNANSNTNNVDTSNVQGQIQGQGQKQSTENSNNSSNSVTVEGNTYKEARNAVNTAFAPSIAPTANCALSVSGGFSVIGASASFGKAYVDENCAALEKVRTVSLVLGDNETAEAMMCQDKAYAKARATAGRACPVESE